jgi:membrane fusion protein, multidrug efflux system
MNKQLTDKISQETPPPSRRPEFTRSRRGRARVVVIALILIGLAVWGGREVVERLTHVYEYDARVTGDVVIISSRVAGWMVELAVDEGDKISQGQVLARIDSRSSAFRLASLDAQMKNVRAERERSMAERAFVDAQTSNRILTRSAFLKSAEAARAALQPQYQLARAEMDRAEALFERGNASVRQVDQARATLQKIEADMRKLDAERLTAQAEVEEARAERFRLAMLDRQLDMMEHKEAEMAAERNQQQVDLEDRTIRAPSDGIIDRTFVESGQYVSAGQRLLMMHDPKGLWVEANIKETAIRRLKVGQPVDVTIDAYPDKVFAGRVARIGSSTTSNFALLPTPNPSGNFTKITQRLPVRIDVNGEGELLRPGMMVEVNIDTRNR